jgi:hypothetical protein
LSLDVLGRRSGGRTIVAGDVQEVHVSLVVDDLVFDDRFSITL